MEVYQDFRDVFALFNAHKVDYAIVGAHALAHYGAPRYTGDIDILVRSDVENALRVLSALEEFGFGSLGLKPGDFSGPDKVVQLGLPPVRIDIITSLTGVSWEDVVVEREVGTYGDTVVYFIGKRQLILNKRATGRKKDLADLEAIGED